jgi:hypothetical protein
MNYVCGFLIQADLSRIVMIQKEEGINGIGGKIGEVMVSRPTRYEDEDTGKVLYHNVKEKETPQVAMAREFEEETGVIIMPENWFCFYIKQFKDGTKVYYFLTFGESDLLNSAKSMTDEAVVDIAPQEIISHMQEFYYDIPYLWLIFVKEYEKGTLFNLNPEGVNF